MPGPVARIATAAVVPAVVEPAKPKVKPGLKADGAPLADTDVWSLKLNDGKRPVDTSNGIDGWERRALFNAAQKNPADFLARLRADSMNGTPVSFEITREIDIGVMKVHFKAENGLVDSTVSLDVYNKKADEFVKPYLAKDGHDKGLRAQLAFGLKGALTDAGGLDDVQLELRAANIPHFSAKKLLELNSLQKDLKEALKIPAADQRQERVLELVDGAMDKLSEIPLPFLMNLIHDDDTFKAQLSSKDIEARASVTLGDGKFAATVSDLLGRGKDEPDLKLRVAGRGGDDRDTISVDELRVYSAEKLALGWGEDGTTPTVSRIKKNGERELIHDHFGEALVYLPMVLAMVGKKPDLF